jgi:signal transduction histidine kinase
VTVADASVLAAVDSAAQAIAAERGLDAVLARLASVARDLTGAPYAAIGLPDGAGGFERFLTDGMDDDTIAAIGWLPRTHGLLGTLLDDSEPYLIDDITTDGRFQGFPDAHPVLRGLLGVPITREGAVVGGFYVGDVASTAFDERDVAAVELLAGHAAVAIDRARLDDLLEERSIIEERSRLARDLHDTLTQRLLGLRLAAATAADGLDGDPSSVRGQLAQIEEQAGAIVEELRLLVDQLRPPDLQREGLAGALEKHAEVTSRASGITIALHVDAALPIDPTVSTELLRVGQEALANAVRHGQPSRIDIDLVTGERIVTLSVRDDGAGFDPRRVALETGSLGLSSMRERIERVGGRLKLESARGRGTALTAEAPRSLATSRPDGD